MHRISLKLTSVVVSCSLITTNWSCQHQLATQQDYAASRYYFDQGHYGKALDNLPDQERGGFIHTFEQAWLAVLDPSTTPQQGTVANVKKLHSLLENRKTILLSHELENFFSVDTEEGYFPAEHEVVIFNLVAASLFLKIDQLSTAKIHLRSASRVLQGAFETRDRHPFDDPMLRLWLGILWFSVGELDQGAVDLRVAARLVTSKSEKKVIAGLIERIKSTPLPLTAILSGSGPEPAWSFLDDVEQGVGNFPDEQDRDNKTGEYDTHKYEEGSGHMVFRGIGQNALPHWQGSDVIYQKRSDWYERHLERDRILKEFIKDSKYLTTAVSVSTYLSVKAAFAATLALISFVAAVAVGVGVGIAGASASGEGAYLTILGPLSGVAFGWRVGQEIYRTEKDDAKELLDNTLSQSGLYRFVRFLPDAIMVKGGPASDGIEFLTRETSLSAGLDKRIQVTFRHLNVPRVAGFDTRFVPRFFRELKYPIEFNKHIYWFLSKKELSFEKAKTQCEEIGAQLPSMHQLESAVDAGLFRTDSSSSFASDIITPIHFLTDQKCRLAKFDGSNIDPLEISKCSQPNNFVCYRNKSVIGPTFETEVK